jgi:integrase
LPPCCPDMEQAVSRKNLTVEFIRSSKAAPPGTRIDWFDAVVPGLALRITDRGHKSFVLVARYPSHPKNPTRRFLGDVYIPPKNQARADGNEQSPKEELTGGVLTLAEARIKARRWLDLLSQGIDPAQQERSQKVEAGKRITFDELRDAFLRHFEQKKKHAEAKRILTKDFAVWNGRLAASIDAQDVDTAIQVMVARGSKYQARNAFGYIRSMYSWAKGRPALGIKSSPGDGLSADGLIGSKKKPRTRVLEDGELRAIWAACNDETCAYPYGRIVQLLLLSGVRENEIARMSRGELVETPEDGRFLVVPSERMKGEEDDPPPPHEIPLTPKMVEILDAMPQFAGPYVFTSTGGQKPVNGWSKAKDRIDKASGVIGWRFHDLRRTTRTRISAIPAEEHVREALLAHGRRGIQAHYDQHRYRSEKRRLLEAWEKKLLSIVESPPPNVADLDKVRRERTRA